MHTVEVLCPWCLDMAVLTFHTNTVRAVEYPFLVRLLHDWCAHDVICAISLGIQMRLA